MKKITWITIGTSMLYLWRICLTHFVPTLPGKNKRGGNPLYEIEKTGIDFLLKGIKNKFPELY
jgi:hypothetical protein